MLRRATLTVMTLMLLASPAVAEEARPQGGGSSYVQLRALTANVTRPNGRLGVMTADVGLDVPDEALRARAHLLVPRLRAEFVGLLQRNAAGLRPGEPPSPDLLSRQFQGAVDRALGRPGARVLLGTVLVN